MRAVILAGGRGTRLRPYTAVLPKPLLPIGDRPVLELIIRQLASHGFERVDLCLGHLGSLIRTYFEEGAGLDGEIELAYHYEEDPLGTAGAVRLLDPRPTEPFVVMNGDILTTIDYAGLLEAHARGDAALTIAAYQQDVKLALGVLETAQGDLTGYIEKPTLSYDVSMGIYVYSPSSIDHIPEGRFDFPDLVLKLIEAGERVATHPFDGEWFDIGTPEQHEEAVIAFEQDPNLFVARRD